MKKVTLFAGIAAISIVLAAFSWMTQPTYTIEYATCKTTETKPSLDSNENIWYQQGFVKTGDLSTSPLAYNVRPKQGRSILEEDLKTANSVSEIIPNYPSKWIEEYSSVDIVSSINNKRIKASGPNDILTKEQKQILNSATVSTNIDITVNFKTENNINKKMESQQMKVLMSVVPKVNAQYIGGRDKLITYLETNGKTAASNLALTIGNPVEILFFVNKQGEIKQVTLENSSGDGEIDEALIQMISKMPKWSPAQKQDGTPVEQEFSFTVGKDGC